MNRRALVPAIAAVALHLAVLAGVATLADTPLAPAPAKPIRVNLLTAPPTPEVVAAAEPSKSEPPKPEPPKPEPPKPEPPKPEPPKPAPPKPAPPKPKPAPRPKAEPPPRPAPAPAPQADIAAPAPAEARAPVFSEPPVPAGESVAPPAAAEVRASASADATAARASAGPMRTAPRVDASWAGNAPPPYPMRARRMGDQGEVLLDVQVSVEGRVTDVRLKRSSGSELLDRTAIETVKQWRFTPATVDGRPVAEWYRDWRWVFRLNG